MSTEVGRRAEARAADYLQARGYRLLERNWRTRWCEIDLVVSKDEVVYFVEVKYRGSTAQGSGLDYITPRKLAQMRFAATFWMAAHNHRGDYQLAAIELTGSDSAVTAWLDEL